MNDAVTLGAFDRIRNRSWIRIIPSVTANEELIPPDWPGAIARTQRTSMASSATRGIRPTARVRSLSAR
jgi:hypothetical protein